MTSPDRDPAAPTAGRLRYRRVLGWLLAGAVLAFGLWLLRGRWDDVRAAGGLPGAAPVVVAAVVHLVANAVSVTTWRRLALLAGPGLPWRAAAWVWSASQLARYGASGAQVAGRAVLARRYGMSATAGGATALVETAWQLAITGALALATLPWWVPGIEGAWWLVVAAAVPVAVLVVGNVAPMRLLRAVAWAAGLGPVRRATGGRLATSLDGISLSTAAAGRLTGLFLLNTALRVGAFLVLVAAVGGDLPRQLPVAVGAFAVGQLAGRLAFFAPGGLGAQEGAAALVLTPALGGPVALLLVAVTRLAELVGEVVFLALARWLRPVSVPASRR